VLLVMPGRPGEQHFSGAMRCGRYVRERNVPTTEPRESVTTVFDGLVLRLSIALSFARIAAALSLTT
jgi:hypothetical protein